MRRLLLLLPLLLSSSALACLNDRDSDSLAVQSARFPDTLRVITGRFERNPPLFYEMRIRRSLAQLKKNPRQFGLYDDIGVAFDRLHKGNEALQIMAKKRALLPPFDVKNPQIKEAWYRYYANAGTFHAHRFLGAKSGNIREMEKARNYIKRAMEIKPNAHFGREKYQLLAMEWILAVKTKKTKESLGTFLQRREGWMETGASQEKERQAAVEGFSGLIVLGAAWQSVDVFEALSAALDSGSGVTLRHLALRRGEEILKNGGRSLATPQVEDQHLQEMTLISGSGEMGIGVNERNRKTLDELFPRLRAEADTWSGQRTAYMLSRLVKGRHPDTDATFWKEWKPAAPPSVNVAWFNQRHNSYNERETRQARGRAQLIGALLILGGTVVTSLLTLRFVKRRRIAA
ncbi:MAG: hypothetical protein KY445_12290 [Armatimonadetes bacterium]|nr:hypothetical protein [Armatimonadota bacterium]